MFKYVSEIKSYKLENINIIFIAFQITLVFLIVAYASAKPQLYASLAYNAPLVTAPVATSALISREFHGNTSPYIAAVPYTAAAYTASAPYVAAASPYFAASPYAAAYSYSPSVFLR